MEPISTIQYNGFTINIYPDTIDDPRKEYDHGGRMITFHRKYEIGDKKVAPHEFDYISFCKWLDNPQNKIVYLPIYLMEHNGLTLKTEMNAFHAADPCQFDWGCIGYIYMTIHEAQNLFDWQKSDRITAAKITRIKESLRFEVEEMDHYINGRVFGYIVTKQDGTEVDSCWGYIGNPEDYVIPHIKKQIDNGVYDDSE